MSFCTKMVMMIPFFVLENCINIYKESIAKDEEN